MFSRLTVAEDTFRGYADTAELSPAWTKTDVAGIATLALGVGSAASIHPARFLEVTLDNQTGSAQDVHLQRELTWVRQSSTEPFAINASDFAFVFFASVDASLNGLLLSGDQNSFPPTLFAPLVFDGQWHEYDTQYSFGITPVGPFKSDGFTVTLTASVPAGASGVVRIASLRVYRLSGYTGYPVPPAAPVIPFAADWSTPPELTIGFHTAVTEGWTGDEQREQLLAQPRGRLRYTITILDDREAALFNALLHDSAGKIFSVPLWSETCRLPSPPSSTFIGVTEVDSRLFWNNTSVLFWRSPFYWEPEQVTAVLQGALIIAQAPSLAFTNKDVAVPLRPGIIRSPIRLERPATRGMRIPLDVELLQI